MFEGNLQAIFIGLHQGAPLESVDQVNAVAGVGLEGDRYARQAGTFSKANCPDRELTLIEREAIDALAGETEIRLEPGQARRNLVTTGVPLNHLVGKDFTVGNVLLRGIRLCEPCQHLEKLTHSGVIEGLKHRGGLRARILRGGLIRPGDAIKTA